MTFFQGLLTGAVNSPWNNLDFHDFITNLKQWKEELSLWAITGLPVSPQLLVSTEINKPPELPAVIRPEIKRYAIDLNY